MLTALRHGGLIKVDSAVDYIKGTTTLLVSLSLSLHIIEMYSRASSSTERINLRVGVIVGEQSAEKRQQMVEAFQANKLDVMYVLRYR